MLTFCLNLIEDNILYLLNWLKAFHSFFKLSFFRVFFEIFGLFLLQSILLDLTDTWENGSWFVPGRRWENLWEQATPGPSIVAEASKYFYSALPIKKVIIDFCDLLGWINPLCGHRSLAEDWVAQIQLRWATLIKPTIVVELHDRASCQINGALTVAMRGNHLFCQCKTNSKAPSCPHQACSSFGKGNEEKTPRPTS